MASIENIVEKASKYVGQLVTVGDTTYKFSRISSSIGMSERTEFEIQSVTTNFDNPVAVLTAVGKGPIMKSLQEIIDYFERKEQAAK